MCPERGGAQGEEVAVQSPGVFFRRHRSVQKHQGKAVPVLLCKNVGACQRYAGFRSHLLRPSVCHQIPKGLALVQALFVELRKGRMIQPLPIVDHLLPRWLAA
nr:hypothetical protein RSP673_17995 [Ralstonia solanacearum P673]